MRRIFFSLFLLILSVTVIEAQSFENQFSKPLGKVLQEIGEKFHVCLKYNVDTTGKVVPYADFRIRPYSVEESMTNVLSLFDYKFVKQNDKYYKIKNYEYPRRTTEDGVKFLAYLNNLYHDTAEWNVRKSCLQKEVRERLQLDAVMAKRVDSKPIFSKIRKYYNYSVQNFALETLPGLYVCGSIYSPISKGKHPLIISPNGHWTDGRYNKDIQIRLGTLARMGAICVSYDLFGWGESEFQVSSVAHQTSVAHIDQIMNGLTILDYMMTRKDIDTLRVAANGGSGGGSQVVLLTLLDNRFTAACPVVSLSSHFDGGCPCESGMPVTLACGGTNNVELMATFAPKPLCVVSDGKDWTASVPELEYPYLKHIYGFYNAENNVSNVHLPNEGHSFGINKRMAVYDFFIKTFGLDSTMLDESKVIVEPKEAMMSFGSKGEYMPVNAVRDFRMVEKCFHKSIDTKINSYIEAEKKAQSWVISLKLNDETKEAKVKSLIFSHLKEVMDWHNEHHADIVPEGINPITGNPLSLLERQMIADSSMPKIVHQKLMEGLNKILNKDQVEAILDKYTVGKVEFTMKGYHSIVTDLTPEEESTILGFMKEAREMAIDYKSMKEISAIFEIYKTKSEQYLNSNGRNWHTLYKLFVQKMKAEKQIKRAN